MMDPKTLLIQRQIVENSKSVNDYYKELLDWEKEANKKDNIIAKQKQVKTSGNNQAILNKGKKDLPIEKDASSSNNENKVLKRDVNSIGDYYKAWDKVDPDEELQEKDSGVVLNNNNKEIINMNLKQSAAKANTNITIKNNRLGTAGSYAEDYIEKMKNEANAYFAIGNYNKSLEMNIAIIKFFDEQIKNSDSKYISIKSVIHNNKGNCFLKLNNFKEALKDFNVVISNDKENIKALFRRGLCHFNLKTYNSALSDFQLASGLSPENEKKTFAEFIHNCLVEINSLISIEKKKMERFEYDENIQFKKTQVNEINSDMLLKYNNNNENENDCKKILLKEYLQNTNISNKENIYKNLTNTEARQESKHQVHINKQNIIKSEEIVKFVYDLTTENLTASSFKYAFRNFKNNDKEKEEYLLKINPSYIPKIFINDLDKEILVEIFNALKGILKREIRSLESFVVDYLKNLTKTNRFKLVIKLMSKKDKLVFNDMFELIKNIPESELIYIKDNFV